MAERVLTVKQPWADLIMAGVKDVENRSWPVPSTLPQWCRSSTAARWRHPEEAECSRLECAPDGPFPFRLWIHAGQAVDTAAIGPLAVGLLNDEQRTVPPIFPLLSTARDRRGVLLGSVTVTGCHHADDRARCSGPHVEECHDLPWSETFTHRHHCSRWAQPDQYHWTIADPVPLDEPIPMRGRQKLWTLPADVAVPA